MVEICGCTCTEVQILLIQVLLLISYQKKGLNRSTNSLLHRLQNGSSRGKGRGQDAKSYSKTYTEYLQECADFVKAAVR
eukprot:g65262.t1